jgi:hypothetical protein
VPNTKDFSILTNVKTININPRGWICPLMIEYGISNEPVYSYFWRVKGTTHTFIIPTLRLDYLSEGDYKKHFEETLEQFREEYLSWKAQNFYLPWQIEYEQQFRYFILDD